MKITSIKIERLFDLFDYDISFENDENILILTGLNGFGKTMILNIIYSLFNKHFLFFNKLSFQKINISLDSDVYIEISKKSGTSSSVIYTFYRSGKEIDKFEMFDNDGTEQRIINAIISFQNGGNGGYIILGDRKDTKWSYEQLEQLPEEMYNNIFNIKSKNILEILNLIKVHFIKEQRLFQRVSNNKKLNSIENEQANMVATIQLFAEELNQTILQSLQEFFQISQDLDSSFPKRLLTESDKISIKEFNKRFNIVREKQKLLRLYGLSQSEQDVPEYNENDSKVLLVYLKDTEKKLSFFDNLLAKIELFTKILNEHRFTFKQIFVNREKGFYFKNSNGKELSLIDLSSGEQHEVILLYELIFNSKPNTLVLIDEPELSLHISWQKEFLKDIIKIIELQNVQVIIATHAPAIINDRWDLVYTLEKVEAA